MPIQEIGLYRCGDLEFIKFDWPYLDGYVHYQSVDLNTTQFTPGQYAATADMYLGDMWACTAL